MNPEEVTRFSKAPRASKWLAALLPLALLLATAPGTVCAQDQPAQDQPTQGQPAGPAYATQTPEQLQQLVAPIE